MMRKVEDIYIELYGRLMELTKDREDAERQLQEISAKNQTLFKNLETEIGAELQEVAEQMSRVNVFINFAREHTQHCEMAQQAAKYDTVPLNRLMVLIDDQASEDRNARQLYTEATGQLKGLATKKGQLQKKAEERRTALRAGVHPVREAAVQKKNQTLENFFTYFVSSECLYALRQLKDQVMPENTLSIGLRQALFPVPEEQTDLAFELLGELWNADTRCISIPVTLGVEEGNVCVAEYTNGTEETVLSGIRNLLLHGIAFTGGDPRYICVFDPIRYNDSALGTLEPLVIGESNLIEKVPTSKEEVRQKLDDIINQIQIEDQLAAKNEHYEREAKFYVFHNFPQGYDTSMQEKIRQLCVNAPHGRMNVFLTHNCSEDGNQFISKNETYEYLKALGKIITITEEGFCTDWDKNGIMASFVWNQAPAQMPEELLRRAREKKEKKDLFGHDYDARVGIQEMPVYRKGVRRLTDIPYGVDESGQLLTLDFENSNFATFICGAARSGKSTLLHTILTGIFQQNHPDDVEVWLIDFKMTEFSRYIKHMPPHVRYIILDESPELVYDIIDRLSEILQKRQNIFKGVWQKLYDVPKEKYMPAMFVVIDEFSIMSQVIADSIESGGNYAEKLQALLAKGAALGMHFIFASQGFTSGTRGLNDFSKKQVQQRIAMKTELSEIKATLDLTSASQQDYGMMEQLPVHKTLTRIPVDEFGNHLCLANVLFISDYKKQEEMIDRINENMLPKPRYDVNDTMAYIYKQPMVIDGNSYHPFADKEEEMLAHLRKNELMLSEEGIWEIFWGEPRRMMHIFPAQVADSYGENIFMLAPVYEKDAALSILLSMKKSLDMQQRPIELWTTRKHGLYQQLNGRCGWRTEKCLDLEEVCEAINACKKAIESKRKGNKFFVLLGFESLMMDMSFQENLSGRNSSTTDTSGQTLGASEGFHNEFKQVGKLALGGDDIKTQMKKLKGGAPAVSAEPRVEEKVAVDSAVEKSDAVYLKEKVEFTEPETSLYDAREDLRYILTQGPRLGYHFLMVVNTMGEFKQMQLSNNLFKHKVLFRTSKDEIYDLTGVQGQAVAALTDHSFRYTNGLSSMNFRPFLHEGLSLDGWKIGADGAAEEEILEEENYLL